MTLPPIIAALRRHKSGVVLITLQIALTLAIVCNAVFIIGQRIATVQRPTGMDEANLFVIQQMIVNAPAGNDAASIERRYAMIQGDLMTLRGLPDVDAAAPVRSLPLLQSSNNGGVGLQPNQVHSTANTTFYGGDEDLLKTLGARLVAGRNFTASEISRGDHGGDWEPPVAIVTRALADQLFPSGDALGKVVYFNGGATPTTIIGIVARLQTPNVGWGSDYVWNSTLLPTFPNYAYTRTAVRAKPGRLDAAMREARQALVASNPMRVMNDSFGGFLGIQPFSAVRARAYHADIGMALLMGVVCVVLLAVTGAGIVGLTSFWVGQRRRQIGIRRALGATRADVLRYFQAENLLIAGAGVVLGAVLAVGLNLWLMHQFAMSRMPLLYVLAGVAALLALGQAAVFAPALRASRVPPVVATRSV